MLSNRLDRGYSSTHAPGYEIDYPPPPIKMRTASIGIGNKEGPVGKEVPPPLPPKTMINPLMSNYAKAQSQSQIQHLSLSAGSSLVGKLGNGCDNGVGDGYGLTTSGTWTAGLEMKSSSLLDSHDRFKPEKNYRRPVQRMKWSQNRWGKSLAGDLFSYSMNPSPLNLGGKGQGARYSTNNNNNNNQPAYFGHVSLPPLPVESESRVSSMTIADVSPRLAVKKVLLLYEHAQYKEAASFINRLSVGTFRIILRELPMEVFLEAMPHSLPIIEALYAKIFAAEGPSVDLQHLKPEGVIMHMVKFFSREDNNNQNSRRKETPNSFTPGCKKILGVIVVSDLTLYKKLVQRTRALDKAVEGMGQHGLVGTTDESILPLHDALKLEFQRVVDTYKGALAKLEELSLGGKSGSKNNNVSKGPAPVGASHQRQLSLRSEEIQERLIKNKSVLNAVEATLDNHCLDILLGILQRRINLDKEALFQFTQLRKETGEINQEASNVAPMLMRYSRGCKQVLEMMKEVGKELGACMDDFEDDSSDLSGYHSDSDSAIMTSGNSPFVTPRARYNFLSRSVRSKQNHRPSLLASSAWSGAARSISKSSGPGSAKSFGGSSFDSSLSGGTGSPDDLGLGNNGGSRHLHHLLSTTNHSSSAPMRPRHVKMKNLLHKNNSLVSSASSTESESGIGTLTPQEESSFQGDSPTPLASPEEGSSGECIECVTVVSVPDNQVITQGVNHSCAKGHGSHNSPGSTSTSSAEGSIDLTEMRIEIAQLKRQLQSANSTIYHLQEKNRNVNIASGKGSVGGGNGVNAGNQFGLLRRVPEKALLSTIGSKEDRKSVLVREYGALYAQARVETMDALDSLTELSEADELKSKLLFSVVVLAFRSVQTRLAEIKEQVSSLLQLDASTGSGVTATFESGLKPCQGKLVEALSDYLSNSQQKFDQSRCIEHVASQLWTTLYDYPCLRKCEGLLKYIRTCVNLAWGLSNQTPPCILEYEKRVFSRDMHVRFHSSDLNSDTVKTYLWPALLDGNDGPCIHKGVVIT